MNPGGAEYMGYSPEDTEPYTTQEDPETTNEYTPYTTTEGESREETHEQRAVRLLNELVQRDEERANERYKGKLLGKVRKWFNREGKRQEADTLEQVGEWEKNPKWKQWIRIGSKIAGGAGIATAMVMTGGAGAFLTPLLFTMGAREAYDGALEVVEQLGWGRGRTKAELGVQDIQSQSIEQLKERVGQGELSEAEFQELVQNVLQAEKQVLDTQSTNMKKEHKWQFGRAIASTVLTMGQGMLKGVPLGTAAYAVQKTGEATQVGAAALDASHKTVWSLQHGGEFVYNSSQELKTVAEQVINIGEKFLPWNPHGGFFYGQTTHTLGHGISFLNKLGMGAGLAYMGGRILEQLVGRKREFDGFNYGTDYTPDYAPNYPYGTDYALLGEDNTEGGRQPIERKRSPENDIYTIGRYVESFDHDYKTELEQMAQTQEKMSDKCEMAVCIPVAFSEKENIYKTLEAYLDQKDSQGNPIDTERFEINLFVNGPADKEADIDETVQFIEKFKTEHPEIKINCSNKIYHEKQKIGMIRKLVNDLTLVRSLQRPSAEKPLILISNDADMEAIDPDYLDKYSKVFSENPEIEIVGGRADYPKEALKQYPYLKSARRLWQMVDIINRYGNYGGFLPKTLGLNTAVTARAYAEVKGYKSNANVAEDLRLATDISKIFGKSSVAFRNNIEVLTNPRRDMDAIAEGKPIVRAYDAFGMTEKLREKAISVDKISALKPGTKEFKSQLEQDASEILLTLWRQFYYKEFDRNPLVRERRKQSRNADVRDLDKTLFKGKLGEETFGKAMQVFNKAMFYWGAECRTRYNKQTGDVKVKLTNISKLISGLEKE